MTMLEMVVVLALIGFLIAVSIPTLLSSTTAGLDEQAKATASGALDTATRLYATDVTAEPWDPTQWATDVAAAQAAAGRPLTADEKNTTVRRVPARPDISTASLHAANPDIEFTASDTTPSTSIREASMGARLVNGNATASDTAYWVVGVAVLVDDAGSGGSCWMAQAALNAPDPHWAESYLLFTYDTSYAGTNPAQPDEDQCTGKVAANLDPDVIVADSTNSETVLTFDQATSSGTNPVAVRRGSTWSYPMRVSAARVTAAAS